MPRLPLIRHRFQISFVLVILSFSVNLTGCAGFATVSESLFMMSPKEEVELGKKVDAEVRKQFKPIDDPAVVSYIRELGQKIWANSGGGEIAPHFYVVQNKEINAFAIPGGNIYVHTGLIQAADDEAELAGVIGHELGHVILRHSARNVSRQMGYEMVQQIVLGQNSGQAAQIAGSILQSGVMNRYSREDESSADQVAVKTLYKMGYDPLALKTFFAKLQAKYGDSSGRLMKLFASHPPTADRMNNVTALVAQLPPKPYVRPVTDLRGTQGRLKKIGM